MKINIKPLITTLGLLGFIATPAWAATPSHPTALNKLQKEVVELKREMAALKKEVKPAHPAKHTAHSLGQLSANGVVIPGPADLPKHGELYLPVDVDAPGQSFVTSGPYLGAQLQYSGSNLIINNPSINEDVSLLKLRKNINNRLSELGVTNPGYHSHLLLSGDIETQANYKKSEATPHSSDIDVTAVNLDAYLLGPSSWTSGLFELSYQNDIGSTSGVINSNQRTANSRVFVNKAFITIGDFSESPWYGSIGQMYLPFGLYSSAMITNPMTKTFGRTKARAILVGYQPQVPNRLYASAYAFKGDSYPAGDSKVVNNGGINVGFKFNHEDHVTGDIGAGVIGNIADSNGMQSTGNHPLFDGFGSSFSTCTGTNGTTNMNCGSEQLVHRVPAYDVRGIVSIGERWDVIGEYVVASTRFNPNNLSFNNHGAKPQAFNAEGVYTFTAFERPTSVGVGYGFTKQALAIGLPAQRYAAVLNTSVWRSTLESLEFRHDIDYAASTVSSGANVVGPAGKGRSDNVITAQFNLYF